MALGDAVGAEQWPEQLSTPEFPSTCEYVPYVAEALCRCDGTLKWGDDAGRPGVTTGP